MSKNYEITDVNGEPFIINCNLKKDAVFDRYRTNMYSCSRPEEVLALVEQLEDDYDKLLTKSKADAKKADDKSKADAKMVNDFSKRVKILKHHVVTMHKYKRWTFPDYRFPRGTRVVVYGYGDMGHDYVWQIGHSDRLCLEGIVDSNISSYDREADVLPLEALDKLDYDVVLIAVREPEPAEAIKKKLRSVGVDRRRIYWHDVRLGIKD
ncbi:hypothetical protein [Selenomonas sp. AB3002]|uniref:hypothetical protein n=1 Tax=Selenomonas sp. AB3002 TaxID=1392502 RepID=UPI000496D745